MAFAESGWSSGLLRTSHITIINHATFQCSSLHLITNGVARASGLHALVVCASVSVPNAMEHHHATGVNLRNPLHIKLLSKHEVKHISTLKFGYMIHIAAIYFTLIKFIWLKSIRLGTTCFISSCHWLALGLVLTRVLLCKGAHACTTVPSIAF